MTSAVRVRDWLAELRATTDDEERFTGLVVESSRTAPHLAAEVIGVVREFAPDWEGWATELFAAKRRADARAKAEPKPEQLADWFDECRRGVSDHEDRALRLVKYGVGEGLTEEEVRENFRCARLDRAAGIVVDWEAWRREEAEEEEAKAAAKPSFAEKLEAASAKPAPAAEPEEGCLRPGVGCCGACGAGTK